MIKNSILFIFFELLNKAVPFLLLPVLTIYLTPSDHGVIASFTALVSFLAIFIGLSGHGAIDASFFRLEQNRLGIYVANVLIILLLTTFLCLIFVFIFTDTIESKLAISFKWQILAVIVALGQFITLVNLSLWVIEQKPLQFGIYQFLQTTLITVISIILIIIYSYGWEGQLLGVAIGTLVLSSVSLIVLYKRGYISPKIDKSYMKDFLTFGIPMIPHQFGAWLRSQGDKIVLVSLVGTAATGLFAVGYQIGVIMSVFMSSLTKALYPILFRCLNKENILVREKNRIVIFSYGLFLLIFSIAIIFVFAIDYLYLHFIGKEFQESVFLTKLIVVAFMFEGFYYCIVGYLFYFKETARLAKITFSISIVHILLSIVFIYLFGALGAGYALVISGAVQFILIWHLSNKIYPMPWFSFWKKNEI